ncbi:MFS transporter [Fluviispira multicolorata]|uniref:MFS transporter n=1 Tax=Fluviispira multicolorata TaxID=2654512 RepID=A0A833JFI9_9BACT|nr:MFS transporter [Fluviispira multicolorata]KAB8030974.1 MFS transporter [Fluviispira multicolorata]
MNIKQRIALFAGIVVEWFENMAFLLLAPQIGIIFFNKPSYDEGQGLIPFAIGCFATFLGSFYYGYLADKNGRVRSIFNTPVIMGLSSFGMVLLPSYSNFAYSWVLISVLRLFQRFVVSGENGVISVYVFENTQVGKQFRNNYFAEAAVLFGILLATFALYIVTLYIHDPHLQFKTIFLASTILSVTVYIIRKIFLFDKYIKDKKEYMEQLINKKNLEVQKFSISTVIKYIFVVMIIWSIVPLSFFYKFNFLPNILNSQFSIDNAEILKNLTISMLFQLLVMYLVAYIGDKIIKRRIILTLGFLVPLIFYAISFLYFGEIVQFYIYDFGYVFSPVLLLILLFEIIPMQIRCTAFNIGFNFIVTIYALLTIPLYMTLYNSFGKYISFLPVLISYLASFICFYYMLFKKKNI